MTWLIAVDVKTAGGDIGSHQQSDLTTAHVHHGAVAGILGHVPVQGGSRYAPWRLSSRARLSASRLVAEKMIALVSGTVLTEMLQQAGLVLEVIRQSASAARFRRP